MLQDSCRASYPLESRVRCDCGSASSRAHDLESNPPSFAPSLLGCKGCAAFIENIVWYGVDRDGHISLPHKKAYVANLSMPFVSCVKTYFSLLSLRHLRKFKALEFEGDL